VSPVIAGPMTGLLLALTQALSAPTPAPVAGAAGGASCAPDARIEAGRAIFQDGVLTDGKPLVATALGGVTLTGRDATCTNCHRRSGLRSMEGGRIVPNITGSALFSARTTGRRQRPAYDHDSLARVFREGIGSGGQELDPLMPRYDLSADDFQALVAYLGWLSSRPVPGLEANRLHFATVVSDRVDPVSRDSMLDVLETYFDLKTDQARRAAVRASWATTIPDPEGGEPVYRKEVQVKTKRKGRGELAVDRAYRDWVLHVWELTGPRDTWPQQLAEAYRRQPVFAVVSGLVDGPWQPIHEFCAELEVPCVFPNTDLPPDAEDYHSVYLSRGVALEAAVLDRHLRDRAITGEILQVFRRGGPGEAAAEAFHAAATRSGLRLRGLPVGPGVRIAEALWGPDDPRPAAAVLWLDAQDLRSLPDLPPAESGVFASSTLLGGDTTAAQRWPGRAYLVHPFDLRARGDWIPATVRVWMRDWDIEPADIPIQVSTYFTASAVAEAVGEMGRDFSQDYLIEKLEDMLSNTVSVSLFPRVSLGPTQRFASKGAYIVRLEGGRLVPVTDWIVP
jgi:hypothetical protein